MNKLVKTVSKADLLKEFLKSLNGIVKLTDRELDILGAFINLQLNELRYRHGVINRETRKLIMKNLKITPDNLSKYIKRFKEIGVLVPSKQYVDEFVVNEALIPDIIGNRVQITIILKLDNNEQEK